MIEDANVSTIRSWPKNNFGWHTSPSGDVKIGDHVVFGDRVALGDCVKIGDNVALMGKNTRIGNDVVLGNNVVFASRVVLADGVRIGDNATGAQLNLESIAAYVAAATSHVFWKWVTPERKSPQWAGTDLPAIVYEKGAVIEVAECEVSDDQCGPGLHVFRIGQKPEWHSLRNGNEVGNLVCLRVRVRSEDICFAGIATMADKLRVRRLEVLD